MRLSPYVNNFQVGLCPSDTLPWNSTDTQAVPNQPVKGSYAQNPYGRWRMAEIVAPAEFFVMWDTSGGIRQVQPSNCTQGPNAWLGTEQITQSFSWARTDCFAARHQDQINMAFGDGHVKTMRCALVFPCGNKGFSINNRPGVDTTGLLLGDFPRVGWPTSCWNRYPAKPRYTANDGRLVPVMQCP